MCHKSQGPGLPNPRLSLGSLVLWSHNLFPLVFHSEMILRGESCPLCHLASWGGACTLAFGAERPTVVKYLRCPPGGDRDEPDWLSCRCPKRQERDLGAGGKRECRRDAVHGHPNSIGSLGCLATVSAGLRCCFSFSLFLIAQHFGFAPTATSRAGCHQCPPFCPPNILGLSMFASLATLLADKSGLPRALSLP